MKPSDASSEAIGLRAPGTRRRRGGAARCCLVLAAALIGAVAPGRAAAADLEQLANLADQMQAATWSQAAGAGAAASAAQVPTVDVAQTVEDVTHAALAAADPATAIADMAPAAVVDDATGRGASPEATSRASAKHVTRARLHKKARPRPAAAAASPSLVPRPLEQVEARGSPERRISTRDGGDARRADAPGTARGSRAPAIPLDLPSAPFPLAMPSSAGAGSGGGPPVPSLLVALAAAILLFVSEVLIRRVPSRRPTRPRRIVLPTWRPG